MVMEYGKGSMKGKGRTAGYGNEESHPNKEGGETTSEKAQSKGNPLYGAVSELYKQHPHNYDDLGPHQGTSDHVRHKPVTPGKQNVDDPVGDLS